jgi:hypothetical protein
MSLDDRHRPQAVSFVIRICAIGLQVIAHFVRVPDPAAPVIVAGRSSPS